jgi:hypothetical protein
MLPTFLGSSLNFIIAQGHTHAELASDVDSYLYHFIQDSVKFNIDVTHFRNTFFGLIYTHCYNIVIQYPPRSRLFVYCYMSTQ